MIKELFKLILALPLFLIAASAFIVLGMASTGLKALGFNPYLKKVG